MSVWRNDFEKKITSAEHAVSQVKSGSAINIPIFAPRSLLDVLWVRRDELADVRLLFNAPTYNPGWFDPNTDHPFGVDFEIFIGDVGRASHDHLLASSRRRRGQALVGQPLAVHPAGWTEPRYQPVRHRRHSVTPH